MLGALLISNKAHSRVSAFLQPEHFGNAVHARIYAAIGKLVERGQVANPVTLKNLFDQDGALSEIGGAQYLVHLAGAAVTIINAEDYGRVIHDLYLRRQLIALGEGVIDEAYASDPDPAHNAATIAARFQTQLDEISRAAPDRPKLFNPTTLTGCPVPDRQWIVASWIPMKRATGLYGAPGTGKTSIAQMLCTAAAIGQPSLGLPVRRCRSVLLYCEDDEDEMHFRQDAINRFYGCTYDDLGDMRWLPRLGEDSILMTFEEGRGIATPLFRQVLTETKKFGALILVVDTLSDVFAGNELDRSHARQFVQQGLALIAREIKGAVIACAHPSVAGINSKSGNNGSTGWPGAFRSHLYLHSPKGDSGDAAEVDLGNLERVLTRKKMNWATAGETIKMRWHAGVFIAMNAPSGVLRSIGRRTCDRVFLDLLRAVIAGGNYVSESPQASGHYAPQVFSRRADREGYTAGDFKRAMVDLSAAGKIIPDVYVDPARRRHSCIAPAPE